MFWSDKRHPDIKALDKREISTVTKEDVARNQKEIAKLAKELEERDKARAEKEARGAKK
jgi:hypothetical protein